MLLIGLPATNVRVLSVCALWKMLALRMQNVYSLNLMADKIDDNLLANLVKILSPYSQENVQFIFHIYSKKTAFLCS